MLSAYYQFSWYDGNHSFLRTSDKFPSRSFVKNFLNMLTAYIGGSPTTFLDVNGVTVTGFSNGKTTGGEGSFFVGAIGGDLATDKQTAITGSGPTATVDYPAEKIGLMLGTGTTGVTASDRSLATWITHGRSAGQLEYLPCATRNFTINSGTNTATFDVERLFRNVSGGTININELGLAVMADGTSYGYSVMILRDVLGVSQSVNDSEYLKVTYTLQIVT